MRLSLVFLGAAILAACGGPDPVAEEAENASALPEITQTSPSPTGAAPATGVPAGNAVTPTASAIPAALRGRWGLSPGDCTPRGGAQGLLTVTGHELRFYESRAVPAGNVQTSANSISGDFAFTGEGENWTKHQTFELRDRELVRTDRDPIASFRYVRCD